MLSPFAPHACEEAWERLGKKPFVSLQPWPRHDGKKISREMELGEKLVEQTRSDIKEVLRLARIERPSKISVYVSPAWKYDLFRELGKLLEKTRDFREIMSAVTKGSLKAHGNEITKILPKYVKSGAVPEAAARENELRILSDFAGLFEEEFGCKIQVVRAEESKSDKAAKAMPGKPGIEVE
jgi:leucyl-tRNA synthetase